jgi:hypothetical protein
MSNSLPLDFPVDVVSQRQLAPPRDSDFVYRITNRFALQWLAISGKRFDWFGPIRVGPRRTNWRASRVVSEKIVGRGIYIMYLSSLFSVSLRIASTYSRLGLRSSWCIVAQRPCSLGAPVFPSVAPKIETVSGLVERGPRNRKRYYDAHICAPSAGFRTDCKRIGLARIGRQHCLRGHKRRSGICM